MKEFELARQLAEYGLQHLPELMAIGALGMAYTDRQRKKILDRDDHQCQFPVGGTLDGERCGITEDLQVHHILCQMAGAFLGLGREEVDSKYNGITLCKAHHTNTIHTDMPMVWDDWKKQKQAGVQKHDSFKKMQENRSHILKDEGMPYWNTAFDTLLRMISIKNTKEAEAGGWQFPRLNKPR
jgi:hypothetical protein